MFTVCLNHCLISYKSKSIFYVSKIIVDNFFELDKIAISSFGHSAIKRIQTLEKLDYHLDKAELHLELELLPRCRDNNIILTLKFCISS